MFLSDISPVTTLKTGIGIVPAYFNPNDKVTVIFFDPKTGERLSLSSPGIVLYVNAQEVFPEVGTMPYIRVQYTVKAEDGYTYVITRTKASNYDPSKPERRATGEYFTQGLEAPTTSSETIQPVPVTPVYSSSSSAIQPSTVFKPEPIPLPPPSATTPPSTPILPPPAQVREQASFLVPTYLLVGGIGVILIILLLRR